jgi:hypothetical protein
VAQGGGYARMKSKHAGVPLTHADLQGLIFEPAGQTHPAKPYQSTTLNSLLYRGCFIDINKQ